MSESKRKNFGEHAKPGEAFRTVDVTGKQYKVIAAVLPLITYFIMGKINS